MIPREEILSDPEAEAALTAQFVTDLDELELVEPGLGWAMLEWIERRLAQGLEWRDPTLDELRALSARAAPVVA